MADMKSLFARFQGELEPEPEPAPVADASKSIESRLLSACAWVAENHEELEHIASEVKTNRDSFTKYGRTYDMLYLRHDRWTDRAGRSRPFKFGRTKAMALLAVLPEIVDFVSGGDE